MSDKELTRYLSLMRDSQRLYWRTRHTTHLDDKTKFEKIIDAEILKRKKKEITKITRQFEFEHIDPPPHGW